MAKLLKCEARDGLIYIKGEPVNVGAADAIAFRNKIWHAENLAKEYNGKTFYVDESNLLMKELEEGDTVDE